MHTRTIIIAWLSIMATAACSAEWVIPPDYFVECNDASDCPDTASCMPASDGNSSICVTDGQPQCGNGVIETGEICDDGENNANDYRQSKTCLTDCSGYGSHCGDNNQDPAEVCDNSSEDSGCTQTCERSDEVVCGDFITHTSFEECDEGNIERETCEYGSPDGCTICNEVCKVEVLTGTWCGDGLLQQDGLAGQSFEGCDGDKTCSDMGLGTGEATCESNCFSFSTQDCEVEDMVYVPAGPFLMGCNALVDFDCFRDELPQHEVDLDAFLIDRFEVTASQYATCVDAGACVYEGSTTSNQRTYAKAGRENYPINYVNWDEASAYCAWQGKALPTEAQWEKAARGPDARKYPWGNLPEVGCDYASTQLDVPDEDTCDDGGIMAVGSKPLGKSIYGAEDMIGNVWEWTEDYYDAAYYQQAPEGMWSNPQGPTTSTEHSLRGGGYGNSASYYFRASTRNGEGIDHRVGTLGFRCAR